LIVITDDLTDKIGGNILAFYPALEKFAVFSCIWVSEQLKTPDKTGFLRDASVLPCWQNSCLAMYSVKERSEVPNGTSPAMAAWQSAELSVV
jgi:hypothetical protein